MTRRRLSYFVIGVLIVAAITLHLTGASHLAVETMLAERQRLQELVAAHPVLSPLTFMAVYVAVTALSLPVATPLSLMAGLLFGLWLGAVLVLISASVGALFVFLLVRSALGASLRRMAGRSYAKIADEMRRNGIGYLLFLRLVPLFPFFAVNVAAGLFDIRAHTFFLCTVIGIAPGTFIYVNFGRQLGIVSEVGDLLSPGVIAGLTLLGVLALTPIAYRHWTERKSRSPSKTEG